MEILKVDNLTKIYGKDTTKVVALDHVSFSVEEVLIDQLLAKFLLMVKIYLISMMINLLYLEEGKSA